MEEGLNLNLVLNGATLVTVAGLAVRVWLAGRSQKIGPQPFQVSGEISAAVNGVSEKVCDDARRSNETQHENMYARIAASERAIARLEANHVTTTSTLASIDEKLTVLLKRR